MNFEELLRDLTQLRNTWAKRSCSQSAKWRSATSTTSSHSRAERRSHRRRVYGSDPFTATRRCKPDPGRMDSHTIRSRQPERGNASGLGGVPSAHAGQLLRLVLARRIRSESVCNPHSLDICRCVVCNPRNRPSGGRQLLPNGPLGVRYTGRMGVGDISIPTL